MKTKKISGCQGLGGGAIDRQNTEDFYSRETILYDTTMVNT